MTHRDRAAKLSSDWGPPLIISAPWYYTTRRYHAPEIWQMRGTRAFLIVGRIWCPGPASGNRSWRGLMNKWTKWNKTVDKATTLAAGRRFLTTAVIMGLTLAGLVYFAGAEG